MKVLFACRSNAGRSPVAEAFFKKFSKNRCDSGGISVAAEGKSGNPVGKRTFLAMKRVGVDLSKNKRKQLTRAMMQKADMIVFLLTPLERKKHLPKSYMSYRSKIRFWNVKDMRDASYNAHVHGRDHIRKLVKALVKEVG